MRVIGNDRPLEIEVLGNKKIVSFDVVETTKTNEDGSEYTMYEYEQLKFDISFSDEAIEKEVLKEKMRIAKDYLDSTDHKFFGGYKPKDGEDLLAIENKRDIARDFLRANGK